MGSYKYGIAKTRFIRKIDRIFGVGEGAKEFAVRKFLWNKYLRKRGNPPLVQGNGLKKLQRMA